MKSLHQLQEENRRLEEQIKTLTMKKERLQLLSAQLSVPFTPSTTSFGKTHTHTTSSVFGLVCKIADRRLCIQLLFITRDDQ